MGSGEMARRHTAKPTSSDCGKRASKFDCPGRLISQTDSKQAPESKPRPSLREVLLAELRCGWMRARLAQHEMESVRIALLCGLINEEQAMGELYERDAIHWMFLEGRS